MAWVHDILKPKTWHGETVNYVQRKMNGWRITFYKQPDGKTLLAYGRSRKERFDFPELLCEYPWWKQMVKKLPALSSVDAEIYVKDRPPSDVVTELTNRSGKLSLSAFAVPWWKGDDFADRTLFAPAKLCHDMGIPFTPTWKWEEKMTTEYLNQLALTQGVEGHVVKDANYIGWYKVKPTRTVDCWIEEIKDGNGKYIGLVGAFIVYAYDPDGMPIRLASVSGMSDEVRWMDEADLIGRVCEVEYQDVGSNGGLIHPRFIRFRDDKGKEECVWTEQ